jgi:asparagine synthetase B (glutamine-hydrolysing)
MCGIFAFSKVTEQTIAMAPILALEMEARGDDSWGCTDGTKHEKQAVSILDGFHTFTDWKNWKSVVFHTRGASVGGVSVPNAHPFWAHKTDGKLIIGVHNGHVSNYKEMNKKYERKCEVDSEHIFFHLAEGKNLEELNASGAVVWYDDGKLCWMKSSLGSLEVFTLEDNTVVICSTATPIYDAARLCGVKLKSRIKELDPSNLHYIGLDKQGESRIFQGQDMHFGPAKKDYGDWSGWQGGVRRPPVKLNPNCLICYKLTENHQDVICKECLKSGHERVGEWLAAREIKAGQTGHLAVGTYVN